jgi:hypothetical protein
MCPRPHSQRFTIEFGNGFFVTFPFGIPHFVRHHVGIPFRPTHHAVAKRLGGRHADFCSLSDANNQAGVVDYRLCHSIRNLSLHDASAHARDNYLSSSSCTAKVVHDHAVPSPRPINHHHAKPVCSARHAYCGSHSASAAAVKNDQHYTQDHSQRYIITATQSPDLENRLDDRHSRNNDHRDGCPLTGYDGRPFTGYDGRPFTGYDGRPFTGYDGRPFTGYDSRPFDDSYRSIFTLSLS